MIRFLLEHGVFNETLRFLVHGSVKRNESKNSFAIINSQRFGSGRGSNNKYVEHVHCNEGDI